MEEREQEEGSSSQNVNITVSVYKERGTFLEIILSDSSSFFILPDDFIATKLFPGDIVSEEMREHIAISHKICLAFNKALSLISYAPSSAFMLKQKLIRKGFDSVSVSEAFKILAARKIIDDRAFAENWVSSRLRRNPESPMVLKAALMRKGIERSVAEEVLKELTPDSSQYIEAFEKAFERQMRKAGRTDDKVRISLSRKGYPLSLINKYLDNQT